VTEMFRAAAISAGVMMSAIAAVYPLTEPNGLSS